MTITLRIILLLASLLSAAWILLNIKKAKVRIEDSVFWIFFSVVLILLSVFPDIVIWGAKITGVQSPVNFVFLTIIFVLLIKLFRMTIRLSQLDSKIQTLTQSLAIKNYNEKQ